MTMDVNFDEVFEHVMMNAIIAACDGNGVLDGLTVSENGAGADMSVDVAAGSCMISGTKYTESSTTNLAISAADATYDRKDLVVYDSSAGDPAVITGTAAAIPVPPDIPSGDILLAIIDVGANVTQITNADIVDGVVVIAETGVAKSLFDATTFLYATNDNTPEAKTPADVRTILNVADGADVTADNPPQAHTHAWQSLTDFAQLGDGSTLTISGGAITITSSFHKVATEGGASSDDLTTIHGSAGVGDLLILTAASSAQTVVVKSTGSDFYMASDCSLSELQSVIVFMFTYNGWSELTRYEHTP